MTIQRTNNKMSYRTYKTAKALAQGRALKRTSILRGSSVPYSFMSASQLEREIIRIRGL